MGNVIKVLLSVGIFFLLVWLLAKVIPFLISLAILAVLVLAIVYLVKKVKQENKRNKKF